MSNSNTSKTGANTPRKPRSGNNAPPKRGERLSPATQHEVEVLQTGLPENPPEPELQRLEPVIDPLSIIAAAASKTAIIKTDEELDDELNPLQKGEPSEFDEIVSNALPNTVADELDDFIPDELPKIRKVAIKKINRFNFRLGLEKASDKMNLVPGTAHTWCVAKKGNEFVTGLEELPDVRARLQRILRVDLSPTSSYWATLTFRIEDKEHGQILNFDDPQFGAYHEVIYHAMLASDLIANGIQEYRNGKKPFAEWYIENKDAEAEAAQKDMSYEMEASDLFADLSFDKKRGIGKLAGLAVYGLTDKTMNVEVWQWMRKNAENAKLFLSFARMQSAEFAVRVLVNDAIKANVIRRNRANDYTYNQEVLGPSVDHITARLVLPTNSTLRNAIQRQVEAKTR